MEKQMLRAIQQKLDYLEKKVKNPNTNLKYLKLKRLQHQAYIEYAKGVIKELENKPILSPQQQRRLNSCKTFLEKENGNDIIL